MVPRQLFSQSYSSRRDTLHAGAMPPAKHSKKAAGSLPPSDLRRTLPLPRSATAASLAKPSMSSAAKPTPVPAKHGRTTAAFDLRDTITPRNMISPSLAAKAKAAAATASSSSLSARKSGKSARSAAHSGSDSEEEEAAYSDQAKSNVRENSYAASQGRVSKSYSRAFSSRNNRRAESDSPKKNLTSRSLAARQSGFSATPQTSSKTDKFLLRQRQAINSTNRSNRDMSNSKHSTNAQSSRQAGQHQMSRLAVTTVPFNPQQLQGLTLAGYTTGFNDNLNSAAAMAGAAGLQGVTPTGLILHDFRGQAQHITGIHALAQSTNQNGGAASNVVFAQGLAGQQHLLNNQVFLNNQQAALNAANMNLANCSSASHSSQGNLGISSSVAYGPEASAIRVSNLHRGTSVDDLRCAFSQFGPINDVHIIPSSGGQSSGVALIVFPNRAHCEKAVELYNNAVIDGLVLKIELFDFSAEGYRGGPVSNLSAPFRRQGFLGASLLR